MRESIGTSWAARSSIAMIARGRLGNCARDCRRARFIYESARLFVPLTTTFLAGWAVREPEASPVIKSILSEPEIVAVQAVAVAARTDVTFPVIDQVELAIAPEMRTEPSVGL